MGEIENCPECGSDEIQIIDRVWNEETQKKELRYLCRMCDHDWHEEVEE